MTFHEVIRSFAQDKLVEAGDEKEAMRDRHLGYFLELYAPVRTRR